MTPNASSPSGWTTVRVMRPTAVAVMDSGVDCFHRDLNVIYNISLATVTTPNDAKGCIDAFNHGTNVAGGEERVGCVFVCVGGGGFWA